MPPAKSPQNAPNSVSESNLDSDNPHHLPASVSGEQNLSESSQSPTLTTLRTNSSSTGIMAIRETTGLFFYKMRNRSSLFFIKINFRREKKLFFMIFGKNMAALFSLIYCHAQISFFKPPCPFPRKSKDTQ